MRYGDLGGKGRVYDEAGKPILLKSEVVKSKSELRFGVYKSLLASKPFILDFYEGDVYLTDRRLIGIRRPDPKAAALARLSYTADMDVLETADRMRQVREKGAFEFFSVGFDEMLRVRRYRLYGAVEILAPDEKTGKELKLGIAPEKKFRALFGPDRYEMWMESYRGNR
jgi:hypothetical protein